MAALLAIVLLATRPVELGDTRVYANDIVARLGKSPLGPANSIWEPGHLFWRPLGWVLESLAGPILSRLTDWTPFMQVSFLLMAVSVLCALTTVVLWHAMVLRLTGSRGIAFLVCLAMACSDGFLLRVDSGSAYVPALMLLTVGLCCLSAGRTLTGALFYALSALTWLPFILAGPSMLMVAALPSWNWKAPVREAVMKMDRRAAVRFVVGSAAIVLLMYGFALYAMGATSAGEAAKWFSQASHGYAPNIKVVRIASGLPRSFLFLGKDAILYKRYLRHDPYAPVTLWQIAGASFWKVAAFYLSAVCLLYELVRRPRSARMLMLVGLGAVPTILFAITLFETGSPERYVPALLFIVLATAWALRDFPSSGRATQYVVAGFLVCVILTNVYAFAAPRVEAENSESVARVADLRNRLTPGSIVMLSTDQDDLDETVNRLAFDRINRPAPMWMYYIVNTGNVQVLTWRQNLAARTLQVWRNGGEVWVSKRVWSSRPMRSWNWAEGDDPRVSWKELPQFFSTLHTDAESGGTDGFRRLARDQQNLAALTPLASGAQPLP